MTTRKAKRPRIVTVKKLPPRVASMIDALSHEVAGLRKKLAEMGSAKEHEIAKLRDELNYVRENRDEIFEGVLAGLRQAESDRDAFRKTADHWIGEGERISSENTALQSEAIVASQDLQRLEKNVAALLHGFTILHEEKVLSERYALINRETYIARNASDGEKS